MKHNAVANELAFYLDPKDPECYLALVGTKALVATTGVALGCYPLQIPTTAQPPAQPAANEARGIRHRWFREAYRARELHYYANVLQLPLQDIYRSAESTQAAMAMLWLQQHPSVDTLTWLLDLCTAHFRQPISLTDDQDAIQRLLVANGAKPAGLARFWADEGPRILAAQLESNAAAGVIRGPAYEWQGELYIGREHLPLLHSLIGPR